MEPGVYNISVPANAMWTESWTVDSITTATDYSARLDIRVGPSDSDTLLLSLTSTPAAGITLSVSGGELVVTIKVTASQMDTLRTAMATASIGLAYYSLKITPPTGADDAQVYIVGSWTITETTVP